MSADKTLVTRGQFVANVVSNKQIRSKFHKLVLEFDGAGAKVFAQTRPGQFVELDVSGAAVPEAKSIPAQLADAAGRKVILRRPFCFCDADTSDDRTTAEILYRAVGPASLRMTTVRPGGGLSVIGPLGNGYWVPQDKKTAVLVIGGTGAPPLQHLAKVLSSEHPDISVMVIAGAKTKTELPFEGRIDDVSKEIGFPIQVFAKYGIESQVATDDGSLGFEGLVTACLAQWLEQQDKGYEHMIMYACGPEVMLAEVARIARQKNIDCQVSMERRMACGIGVCQSCAVECRLPDSCETIYKLCCEDGPVFDAKEVVF